MITFFSTFGDRTIDKKLAELLGGPDQARPAASPAEADILVLVRRAKSAGVDDPLAWYDGAKPAVLVVGRPDPEGLALAEEAARRGVPPDLILLSPEGAASMPLADVAAAVRRALERKGGGAPGEEQSGKDALPPPVLGPAEDGALSGRAARRDASPGEGGDVPAEPAGTPPRPAAGDVPEGLYGSTFSGGVAEYGIDGRTARKVVEAADRALYTAKADGRNNVKLAGQQPQRSPTVFVPRIATGKLAVRVFVVIGTAHRVGATAFALGLAARAASKYPVEVIDAGGGASRWLKDGVVSCRKAPPLSVVPGVVTVIDAGLEASPEALSLAQAVFVVTDAVTVASKSPVPGGYLVGGRGAPEEAVKELARLWAMEYFGCLSEAQEVKQAELAGGLPRPRSWRKLLGRVVA